MDLEAWEFGLSRAILAAGARLLELLKGAQSVGDGSVGALRSLRLHLLFEAESILAHEAPVIPLYFYTKSTLIKPWVKGYWNNALNRHFVRWMWIDALRYAYVPAVLR